MVAASTSTTRTPHGISSWRSVSPSAVSAALAASSGPANGGLNRTPIVLTITMRPRARRSAGSMAWVTASWPVTFTSGKLPAERVERHQFGRAGQAVAGVVDQAVQAAAAGVLVDGGSRGGDLAGLGDVEDDGGDLRPRRNWPAARHRPGCGRRRRRAGRPRRPGPQRAPGQPRRRRPVRQPPRADHAASCASRSSWFLSSLRLTSATSASCGARARSRRRGRAARSRRRR